ncbi:hypothetical protein HCU64_23405 [Methylobacterium sp. C25]|uniref:hypothetical protein n=1 Tax=Methylobacterium sp. C25 TaxID=2721622 RepID=UPI001F306B23|nr:hypothetical protein [Methylobacterium sp. C25]MCE4226693.1 hypothetical protein [Methylobacterium sp. C25]
MSEFRRFLIAPSLARLIRKERGGSKRTEGYFAPQAGRVSFVRIEGADCHLVLTSTDAEGKTTEEVTEVPRSHGDALLDVCKAQVTCERMTVSVSGQEVLIDRYVSPAGLDVISVGFDEADAAKAFAPPVWFGVEVTDEPAYQPAAIAIEGAPAPREVAPSNAALDAVLDLLEPRYGFGSLNRPRVAA